VVQLKHYENFPAQPLLAQDHQSCGGCSMSEPPGGILCMMHSGFLWHAAKSYAADVLAVLFCIMLHDVVTACPLFTSQTSLPLGVACRSVKRPSSRARHWLSSGQRQQCQSLPSHGLRHCSLAGLAAASTLSAQHLARLQWP